MKDKQKVRGDFEFLTDNKCRLCSERYFPLMPFIISDQEPPLPGKQVSTVFEELTIHFIEHKQRYTISEVTIFAIFQVKNLLQENFD